MTSIFTVEGQTLAFDTCPKCRVLHGFPRFLYDAAKANAEIKIHCPNGHPWHYKSREELCEDERVRRERDLLRQQIAQKDDEIAAARKSASAARGQVTRLRNRAAAGMCPCCNRHFDNVQRHIESKHRNEPSP